MGARFRPSTARPAPGPPQRPPGRARGFAAWLEARLRAAGLKVVPGLGGGPDRLFLGVRNDAGGAAAVEPEGMPAHLDPEDWRSLRPALLRRLGRTVLPVASDEA